MAVQEDTELRQDAERSALMAAEKRARDAEAAGAAADERAEAATAARAGPGSSSYESIRYLYHCSRVR